jgi:hypothetical protein
MSTVHIAFSGLISILSLPHFGSTNRVPRGLRSYNNNTSCVVLTLDVTPPPSQSGRAGRPVHALAFYLISNNKVDYIPGPTYVVGPSNSTDKFDRWIESEFVISS